MHTDEETLNNQITLIKDAMIEAGVWTEDHPEWIKNYQEGPIVNIWQWLQFIHLPMRLNGSIQKHQYLAPRLSPYMNGDSEHQHILQLVIELDSISSTIKKK